MDETSTTRLVTRIVEPDDPLTPLGLVVLMNKLSEQALGVELPTASVLSRALLGNWFRIAAWCAMKGLRFEEMPVHHLFPILYGWGLDNTKAEEIDRLNRTIFGTAQPW